MTTRAGSHAGRGFRYQDAVAAWFALEAWLGRSTYNLVIPEGRDDIELAGPGGKVVGQVKSRRQHVGLFSPADVARYIRELWTKGTPEDQFLLIIEAGVTRCSLVPGKEVALGALAPVLAALTEADSDRFSATRIVFLPQPKEAAASALEARLACSGLEASVGVASIADLAGRLSDENGEPHVERFRGIATSDTQRELDRLSTVLESVRALEAIERGLCEAVEFVVEHSSSDFYLGVDVQPGHVTSRLVVERPELRERVITGLSDRRSVLIRGPSGAGKSALLWEAAHASRHTVRWFKVRQVAANQVHLLMRLADSCLATQHTPVGFVLDDLGAGLSDGWNALVREVRQRKDVVLLATVREEDLALVTARASTADVELVNDDEIAERIWNELRARSQTAWEGWREAWSKSNGLLLEYVYILTQGARLSEVLRDQVAARQSDRSRRGELRLLRLAACAGAAGASVQTQSLARIAGMSDDEAAESLRRLIDEHLVRQMRGGQLSGLHELRSQTLLDLAHEVPPPLLSQTIADAAQVVVPQALSRFIARSVAMEPAALEPLVAALAERIRRETSLPIAAAALSGLAQLQIERTIDVWMEQVGHGIAPSLLNITAVMGVAGIEMPLVGSNESFVEASRLMGTIKREMAATDPRISLLERLGVETLWQLVSSANAPRQLDELLSHLLHVPLSNTMRQVFEEASPDLLGADLDTVAALMATAEAVDARIPAEWVARVSQEALINRITSEVPWVTRPVMEVVESDVIMRADVYLTGDAARSDLHAEVVSLCELLLWLVPSSTLIVSRAITADGEIAGVPDNPIATKEIPRGNLPAATLVQWNRRWSASVNARVAPPNYTSYLAKGVALLQPLVENLTGYFDQKLRGKTPDLQIQRLVRIHSESQLLSSDRVPATSDDVEAIRSALQAVLSESISVLTRLNALPTGANALVMHLGSHITNIDKVAHTEPWHLLGMEPPTALSQLRSIAVSLRELIGEASAATADPFVSYRQSGSRPGRAWPAATAAAKQQLDARVKEESTQIRAVFETSSRQCQVFTKQVLDGASWPPVNFLVVPEVSSVQEWLEQLPSIWALARGASPQYSSLLVVPNVRGKLVPRFGVSGFDCVYPSPTAFAVWSSDVGLSQWQLPTSDMYSEYLAALTFVATMNALEQGRGGGPEEERRARERGEAAVADARRRLEGQSMPWDVSALIQAVAAEAETNPTHFARCASEPNRGVHNELMLRCGSVGMALAEFDINQALLRAGFNGP